ncbi:MAG: SDR family NAD(P)-dependent oxidoreductase, partial [Thermodesulfobacteriota bacterium]
ALLLAKRGAKIVINYNKSETEANQLVNMIKGTNGEKSIAVKADITNPLEVKSMVETIMSHFESIDILINNAGIYFETPIWEISEKDWDLFMNVNLKGPFLCSQIVGRIMSEKRSGKIINITDSIQISEETVNYMPYIVSKAGLTMLTKALARVFSPTIHVNAIAPGPVLLPENFSENEKKKAIASRYLKRIGTPQDIANAVIFLIESDYITGEVIHVDGGT